MDNDTLLRRIALATEAKSAARANEHAATAAAAFVRQPAAQNPPVNSTIAFADQRIGMNSPQRQPIPAIQVPPTAPAGTPISQAPVAASPATAPLVPVSAP